MSPVPFSRMLCSSACSLFRFGLSGSRNNTSSAVTQPPPPWSSNGYKLFIANWGVLMSSGNVSGLSKKPLSDKPSRNSSTVSESDPSSSMSRKNSMGPPNSLLHQLANVSSTAAPRGSTTSSRIESLLWSSSLFRARSRNQRLMVSPTYFRSVSAAQNSPNDSSPSPSLSKCLLQARVMLPPPFTRNMPRNCSTSAVSARALTRAAFS
mmetsp:Transcript_3388/g.9704  ORF Transcript_3388/g.9704 Transcript_3388/m.9704 type:complete len:208 (+) Transcript_3388:248-871(+)